MDIGVIDTSIIKFEFKTSDFFSAIEKKSGIGTLDLNFASVDEKNISVPIPEDHKLITGKVETTFKQESFIAYGVVVGTFAVSKDFYDFIIRTESHTNHDEISQDEESGIREISALLIDKFRVYVGLFSGDTFDIVNIPPVEKTPIKFN